ncbi:hypothetical protein GGR55DRAFT_700044 [Xylaria sp. FL0064]|nr:hypothetical protein GGR55DRAFT_700044 [Xylaria sp. FL0064]
MVSTVETLCPRIRILFELIAKLQDAAEDLPPTPSTVADSGEASRTGRRPRVHKTGSFPCAQCGRVLSRKDALVRHIRQKHGNGMAFWCRYPHCVRERKGFVRFWEYGRHMLEVHHTQLSTSLIPEIVADRDQASSGTDGTQVAAQPVLQAAPRHNVQPQGQNGPQRQAVHPVPQLPPYQAQQTSIPQYRRDFDVTASTYFGSRNPYPARPSQATPGIPAESSINVELVNACICASHDMRASANTQQRPHVQPGPSRSANFSHGQSTQFMGQGILGPQQPLQQGGRPVPVGSGLIMHIYQSRYSQQWPNGVGGLTPLNRQ